MSCRRSNPRHLPSCSSTTGSTEICDGRSSMMRTASPRLMCSWVEIGAAVIQAPTFLAKMSPSSERIRRMSPSVRIPSSTPSFETIQAAPKGAFCHANNNLAHSLTDLSTGDPLDWVHDLPHCHEQITPKLPTRVISSKFLSRKVACLGQCCREGIADCKAHCRARSRHKVERVGLVFDASVDHHISRFGNGGI